MSFAVSTVPLKRLMSEHLINALDIVNGLEGGNYYCKILIQSSINLMCLIL